MLRIARSRRSRRGDLSEWFGSRICSRSPIPPVHLARFKLGVRHLCFHYLLSEKKNPSAILIRFSFAINALPEVSLE